ncbi:MAG TPA: ABC transporter permease [bacterium]|jgi:peptide/nickel transport system permease protein
MGRIIASRLIQGVIVIIGITFLVFFATFLTGDPASLMLGEGATKAQVDALRQLMGFDRPLLVQYASFLGRAVRGDFGTSLYFHKANLDLVLERLPATIQLATLALLLALSLAIPLGILAAVGRQTWLDAFAMVLALIGQATPNFWLGIMLILVFAVDLHWFPASGRGGLAHLVLPTITLATFPLALNARMVRSTMLEVLGEDYVRTARAKGLTERLVLYKHALRNALNPVITVVGLQVGAFMGGSVIVETVFAWPGLGRLAVQAILVKDFPLVQTAVTFLALVLLAVNLIVDILYFVIDPRVRY